MNLNLDLLYQNLKINLNLHGPDSVSEPKDKTGPEPDIYLPNDSVSETKDKTGPEPNIYLPNDSVSETMDKTGPEPNIYC